MSRQCSFRQIIYNVESSSELNSKLLGNFAILCIVYAAHLDCLLTGLGECLETIYRGRRKHLYLRLGVVACPATTGG